jgi:hypothetical protein
MGRSIAAGLGILAVAFTLSWAVAQTGTPPRTLPPEITNPGPGQAQPNPIQPVSGTKTEPGAQANKTPPRITGLVPSKLNELQKQMLYSTQRATIWMARMHGANGRFVPGLIPALKLEMEEDSFLRQAAAAFALARAAQFSGEAELNARALQTILSLLDETDLDEKTGTRFTPLPSVALNRLGSAGLLVAAINELPEPRADLLTKSEQLCAYIRSQARPEGWLSFTDTPPEKAPGNCEEMQTYPGQALYGLQLSQRHRPATWKSDLLKKAVAFYHPWWRANKSLGFVPWQTAAYTEAYLRTRDKDFANCVLEMNDWLAGLQYSSIDQRNPQWYGGFKSYTEGRVVESAPTASAACYAESLVEASRVTRDLGDPARDKHYVETLQRGFQFLMTLQYSDANTQHFTESYRLLLVGGFHPSHLDGNLRIDHTQQGLTALIQALDHVVLR